MKGFYIRSIPPTKQKGKREKKRGRENNALLFMCVVSYFIIPKYGHLHTTLFKVNDDNYTFKYKVIN
jgi:hypothetical protein